jgi:hypothetical protein
MNRCTKGGQYYNAYEETYGGDAGRLKPIKPNYNSVFLTYLHTTYVSFIPYIPSAIYQVELKELKGSHITPLTPNLLLGMYHPHTHTYTHTYTYTYTYQP